LTNQGDQVDYTKAKSTIPRPSRLGEKGKSTDRETESYSPPGIQVSRLQGKV